MEAKITLTLSLSTATTALGHLQEELKTSRLKLAENPDDDFWFKAVVLDQERYNEFNAAYEAARVKY